LQPNASAPDPDADCKAGVELHQGDTIQQFYSDGETATFNYLFIPNGNVTGVSKLLLEVRDPHLAESAKFIAEITVLPINDPPYFTIANATKQAVANTSRFEWIIVGRVEDVDFRYGENVTVTYTLHWASPFVMGTDPATDDDLQAWFVMPASTEAGGDPPCVLGANARSITCTSLIEEVNGWLRAGITLEFNETVHQISVEMNVNDLGNIDYHIPPPPLNTSKWLNGTLEASALTAATKAATSNVALIAAPIAGLLAGAIIAGLIFAIRKNKAKAAVENYFDRFALGMEGATNTSPLYEGATKGGESPIYKSSS
jgi:hypothetical protein